MAIFINTKFGLSWMYLHYVVGVNTFSVWPRTRVHLPTLGDNFTRGVHQSWIWTRYVHCTIIFSVSNLRSEFFLSLFLLIRFYCKASQFYLALSGLHSSCSRKSQKSVSLIHPVFSSRQNWSLLVGKLLGIHSSHCLRSILYTTSRLFRRSYTLASAQTYMYVLLYSRLELSNPGSWQNHSRVPVQKDCALLPLVTWIPLLLFNSTRPDQPAPWDRLVGLYSCVRPVGFRFLSPPKRTPCIWFLRSMMLQFILRLPLMNCANAMTRSFTVFCGVSVEFGLPVPISCSILHRTLGL